MLKKLRHPGIISVHKVEESRTSLVIETEPVACSLADALRRDARSFDVCCCCCCCYAYFFFSIVANDRWRYFPVPSLPNDVCLLFGNSLHTLLVITLRFKC